MFFQYQYFFFFICLNNDVYNTLKRAVQHNQAPA